MTELRFRIVNVFTQDRGKFTGNPLCVFEDGEGVDAPLMQALARQFNLSETTFLLPSQRADARVRIFTPSYEMPFAGHPTLGSAFVCRALGRAGDQLNLEVPAGVIPVRARGDHFTLQANPATVREVDEPRAELAEALGLAVEELGERPLWVKAGKEQLIVPLTSEAAVRRVKPRADALARLKSEDGHSMAYVFAPSGPGRVLARFFFPHGSALLEDPATGSAAANLGGHYLALGHNLPLSLEIEQGQYTGRPSTLRLELDAERRIFVGGDVVEIARGVVTV